MRISRSRVESLAERVVGPPALDELFDDGPVHDALPGVDAADCIGQLLDACHALLEEVADARGRVFEQAHGVARLQVLGKDEHPGADVLLADSRRCDDALVGVGRRHADVDDREVGFLIAYERHQLIDVTRFADEFEACSHQQQCHAFSHEGCVVGDYDSHGIFALRTVPPPG